MEFETAIFRIYDRFMGIDDVEVYDRNRTSWNLTALSIISFLIAMSFFGIFVFLHHSYVGQAGCLPGLLESQGLYQNDSDLALLRDDQILNIMLDSSKGNKMTPSLLGHSDNLSLIGLNKSISHPHSDSKDDSTFRVDYAFATDPSLLYLSSDNLNKHGFQQINVTMTPSQCFGSSTMQKIIPIGGVDVIVVNYVKHTIKKGGLMKSRIGDHYYWSSAEFAGKESWLEHYLSRNWILIVSLVIYFCLSTTTALFIRVLLSSGIICFFPILQLLPVLR